MRNANALFLKFQEKIKEAKENNPNIFPLAASKFAHSCFSDQENALIHQTIVLQARSIEAEENKLCAKPEVLKQAPKSSTPAPEARRNTPQSHVIDMTFEGEQFFIEEKVKNKILAEFPKLYRSGEVKGEARHRPLPGLMHEIFYYVVKAGSMTPKPIPQLKRYHIARKVCLNGEWEKPAGLYRPEITARENKWSVAKRNEIDSAKQKIEIAALV